MGNIQVNIEIRPIPILVVLLILSLVFNWETTAWISGGLLAFLTLFRVIQIQ